MRPRLGLRLLLLQSVTALFVCVMSSDAADICLEEVSRLRLREKSLKHQLHRQEETIRKMKSTGRTSGTIGTSDLKDKNYEDCSDPALVGAGASGWFWIKLDSSLVKVYCDTSGGGGWTVFQRRSNGEVAFNRSWAEYKSGFGDFQSDSGEFWLGNDRLHSLTSKGNYSLRIKLMDFDGNQRYAEYRDFRVGHEQDLFRLSFGEYMGTAGDALSGKFQTAVESWASHQGANFSTYDRDHDNYIGNCAEEDQGGWWFNRCHGAHLNGRYYPGGHYSAWSDNGIVWFPWRGWWYSLSAVVMEIRPTGFRAELSDVANGYANGAMQTTHG